MKHNATILEAHQIAVEEATKVNQFYLNQIPPFTANMIRDALLAYGLITVGQQPIDAPPAVPDGMVPDTATAEEVGATPIAIVPDVVDVMDSGEGAES